MHFMRKADKIDPSYVCHEQAINSYFEFDVIFVVDDVVVVRASIEIKINARTNETLGQTAYLVSPLNVVYTLHMLIELNRSNDST